METKRPEASTQEDGTPIKVGVGWCALEDGKIAEMWFVAEEAPSL